MLHYKGYDISTRTLHAQGPAISVTAYIVRRGETVVHRGTVRGPFYSEGVAHFAAEAAASEWIDGSRQVRGRLDNDGLVTVAARTPPAFGSCRRRP